MTMLSLITRPLSTWWVSLFEERGIAGGDMKRNAEALVEESWSNNIQAK